jgi:hypothetical protein
MIRVHKIPGLESDHHPPDRGVVHRTFTLSCLYLLFSASSNAADNSRFFRILKQYSDPVYHALDRKIFVEGEYNARLNDSMPAETGLAEENDEIRTFNRSGAHDAGIKVLTLKGDAWSAYRTEADVGLRGTFSTGSIVRSNAMIGREDIDQRVNASENLYCTVAWSMDRYFPVTSRKKCFAGLRLRSKTSAQGDYRRNYTSYELNSSYAAFSKTRTGTVDGHFAFEPAGGVGKPVFITPVYRAFEVERSLKEAGAIRGQLSDSTMVSIAQWIAAEFSENETRDRPRKYIFAMLDTILAKDTMAIDSSRSAFALMNAVEKHDNAYPDMFDGVKVYVGGLMAIRSGYEQSKRMIIQPYDTLTMRDDAGYYGGMESYFPSFNLEWGKAISRHFFLSLLAEGYAFNIYLDDPAIELVSNPGSLIRGTLHYLVNDRFFLDMGFGDFRLDRMLSIRQPDQVWLRGNVFIEEKIGLIVSLVHGYSYHDYSHYSFYNFYHTKVETATDRITLELQYEF